MSTRRSFMAFTASAVAAGTVPPVGVVHAVEPRLPADGKSVSVRPDAELLALATEIKRLRTEAEQLQDSVEHLPLDDPRSIAVWNTIYGMVSKATKRRRRWRSCLPARWRD